MIEQYEIRQSQIALGDVSDTWELVRTVDSDGDESEDIVAVFQTEYQVRKHCTDNSIKANSISDVEPVVFYHVTDADFDRFDDSFKGSNTAADNAHLGHFFLSERNRAEDFLSDYFSGRGRIIEAKLDLRNPISFLAEDFFSKSSQASAIVEVLSGSSLDPASALEWLDDNVGLGEWQEMPEYLCTDEAREVYVRHGYDSAIASFGDDVKEYIVFSPDQIEVLSDDIT